MLFSSRDQNDFFQRYSYFSGDCLVTSILICSLFTQHGARVLKEKKKLNENQGQNVKKYVLVQYAIANTKGKCWQNPENLGAHQKKRLLGHGHDKLLGRAVI